MVALANVTKFYGNKVLFRNAGFQINPGEKIGLVGPNGAGKTTIFRLLTGEVGVDEGAVARPDKLVIGYFSQNIGEMSGKTVLEEVRSANPKLEKIGERLKWLEERLSQDLDETAMTKTLEEFGELQSEYERLGGYNLESNAREILTGLGIGPEDQDRMTESFSGGWKMRIALAKILLLNPELLLMDEPTNHLDMESIIWLEEWLVHFKGSLLMTSHDRDFMNRIVSKIVEIANQRITTFSGNYDFYMKDKAVRLDQLVASAKRQEDMLAKEKEFIARFAARASHAAQVQSRVKKIEKIDIIEVPQEEKSIKFEWPEIPRGGDEVVVTKNLGKTWIGADGSKKLVFSGASSLVKRGDKVAVVGVNGAGKSTFLKIVTGQTDATEGQAVVGPSIITGYFSQNSLDVLDAENTIVDEVHSRLPNSSVGSIRNLLGALKFSGDEVEKKIKVLSGGERSRVVLATILAKPLNFLVLDEPTNHLDIDSREILLEALQEFEGTIMVVSHDRHFLRDLCNRVFELDRQHLTTYDETFEEYMERKKREPKAN